MFDEPHVPMYLLEFLCAVWTVVGMAVVAGIATYIARGRNEDFPPS